MIFLRQRSGNMRVPLLLLFHALLSQVHSDATDYLDEARALMEESPLLDTHIDLPQIFRSLRTIPDRDALTLH
jgi:hypothetical protein